VLSFILLNEPDGVVNCGTAVPDTVILNVLSRILPKLSVARIVNEVVVFCVTSVGIPLIKPLLDFNVRLVGSVPDNNVYVTVDAGSTGVADNMNVNAIPYG
jgi:hypothetical protein